MRDTAFSKQYHFSCIGLPSVLHDMGPYNYRNPSSHHYKYARRACRICLYGLPLSSLFLSFSFASRPFLRRRVCQNATQLSFCVINCQSLRHKLVVFASQTGSFCVTNYLIVDTPSSFSAFQKPYSYSGKRIVVWLNPMERRSCDIWREAFSSALLRFSWVRHLFLICCSAR